MTEKNSCFAAHGSMSRRDGRDGDRRRKLSRAEWKKNAARNCVHACGLADRNL